MPIIDCPTCSALDARLVAHCLTCYNTRYVLVGTEQQLPRVMREPSGIMPQPADALGDALMRLLDEAKRQGKVITIALRPRLGEPLSQGRYDYLVDVREHHKGEPYPDCFV